MLHRWKFYDLCILENNFAFTFNRNWWLWLILQIVFGYVYTPSICNEFNNVFCLACLPLIWLSRMLTGTCWKCLLMNINDMLRSWRNHCLHCNHCHIISILSLRWDGVLQSHLEQINIFYSIPRTHETYCRNQVVTKVQNVTASNWERPHVPQVPIHRMVWIDI